MASSSSSSSSSSSVPRWIYDVFLSFRGEDVRKSFVDNLFFALDQKGIHTFKDDERLERGKSIGPELLKAIEESMIAVIVFSKNYASSSWCLDELAKIMECRKSMGQTVFPFFYDVDPSEVRKQKGYFGEVFAKHESSCRVEIWGEALSEAANLSGWDLKNTAHGHEAKCIQQIVEEILKKLGDTISTEVETLFGIEPRMKKVNSLLGMGLNVVRFVGIWGSSGIGKTTLARAIFDQISNKFEAACFLYDVRETSQKHSLEHLQQKLLSEILMVKDLKINNVPEGIKMISRRLRFKRVLIVLDDVDNLCQLEALARNHDWFGSGSRIIITTKDKHLLVGHGVDRMHKLSLLDDDEALQLFSWKAFKKIKPTKGYEELSYQVVKYAGGLPLALKVLGSALYGRNVTMWRSALDRLIKEGPEGEILEKLRISFDVLHDTEKKIFLDIACFFHGKKKDSAKRILDSFDFYPDIGITVLVEKSLISISKNRLSMHQLIQELGWRIVRQSSLEEPGKYSRLWFKKDIVPVLSRNLGTKKVEGIVLHLSDPEDINVRVEAFKKMNKLRLLKIHNVYVQRGPEHLPNELRWLHWHGFPSKSLPQSFEAEKLVGLKMCYSRVIQVWKGKKMLDKLKFLNLSHSQKLIRTPDFTELPNLERLNLEGCTSLVAVHPSIGVLKRLIFVNLKDCENLKSLPHQIHLESLKIFILSGCLNLPKFPEILDDMEHLLELSLDGTAIKELHASIKHVTNVVSINLSCCKNLVSLPNDLCTLKCLKKLTLSGCSKLESLPEELGKLESLEELHGDGTAITQPPSSILLLKNLKILSFRGCKGGMDEERTTLSLSSLLSRKRLDSRSLVLPSVSGLRSLKKLDISDCNLSDGMIPSGFGCLSLLDELNMGKNLFTNMSDASINQLSRLRVLELVGCTNLEALPELPPSIAELFADDCTSLRNLTDVLTKNENLYKISFSNCFQLLKDHRSTKSIITMLWHHLLQTLSIVDDAFSMYLPGTEMPDWFNNQGTGPSIMMDLPPHWYNNKFMGFALCAVSQLITTNPIMSVDNGYLKPIPGIEVQLCFITHSGSREACYLSKICSIGTDKNVDSEHVCLAYMPFYSVWLMCEDMVHSPNDWCKLEVSIDRYRKKKFVMRKWGIRLVYEDDVKLKDEMTMIPHSSQLGSMGMFCEHFDGVRYTKNTRQGFVTLARLPPVTYHT